MTTVIIANIIEFFGSMVQVGSGAIKKKAYILVAQTVQLLLQAVSLLLLGAVTGAAGNVISCFRNYLCYKDKLNTIWKIVIIILSVSVTIVLNEQGFLGFIPAIICTVYIIFMDVKDPVKFKLLVTLSFIPWIFYHFMIKSYVGVAFDTVTVLTNGITLVRMLKEHD